MNDGDPVVGGRSTAFSRWMFLLVPGLLLVLVAVWWALGLQVPAKTAGFGGRLVTFEFNDTPLSEVLSVIRPNTPCAYDGEQAGFIITLKVVDMREDQALYWISQLTDQRIVLRDGVITVRGPTWLERSYRATAEWSQRVLGFSLWPNR